MRAVDVIRAKRDGGELTPEQIDSFVAGATTGAGWADYQLSALLMAVVWRGMSPAETAHLTAAMIKPQPFMSPDLARDLDDIGQRDPGGFGLSSPSRVVAEEQWRMLQEQYLDSDEY